MTLFWPHYVLFHIDILQPHVPPDIFYDETPFIRGKKRIITRNPLSDRNDRMIGFLLKAGNWKFLQIKLPDITVLLHTVQFELEVTQDITQAIKFTSNSAKLCH